MKEVKLLYHHPHTPNRAVPPKVLQRKDHKGEEHFHEPQVLGKKVIYTVPEDYARRLLAAQGDRYFLLEPKVLTVRFKSADGLSSTTREVKSILGTPRLKQLEELMAQELGEPAPEAPKAPAGKPVGNLVAGGVHLPPDNPSMPAQGNGPAQPPLDGEL